MQLYISGKNIELSPEVCHYIKRKLGNLSHYLPNISEAKVEVSQEKTRSPRQHFVVQVTVDNTGTPLRSEERGADLFTAIDKASAIMHRRIEHYKGKHYHKRKGKKTTLPPQSRLNKEPEAAATLPKIVKVKRFTLKPMAVDEAIDQMDILGHDFSSFSTPILENLTCYTAAGIITTVLLNLS